MEQITMIGDPISETRLLRETDPQAILQAVLRALNEGRIAEVANQLEDGFRFVDHALDLEFTGKARLIEFLQKSRQIFPDAVLEVVSICQSGNNAIAEWKVTAVEVVPYFGSMSLRVPIMYPGVSIVRIQDGKVTDWSDYYDQIRSRRVKLATTFYRVGRNVTVGFMETTRSSMLKGE